MFGHKGVCAGGEEVGNGFFVVHSEGYAEGVVVLVLFEVEFIGCFEDLLLVC